MKKEELSDAMNEIDSDKDSLRFYFLNDNQRAKAEHHGTKETLAVDEPLVL